MDREFIVRRHEGFQVPEETVFDLVERVTGLRPVARSRIVLGGGNEVYRVEFQASKPVIVRIHRDGEVEPNEQAWAIERCRDAGAPVPQVLAIETITASEGELDAMVQECAVGTPLDQIMDGLSEADWASVCTQAGDLLGRVHSIQVSGYYRLGADGAWDFPSFESIKEADLRARASDCDRLLSCGFSKEDCSRMSQFHRKLWAGRRDESPVLCHGDFLPEHIFVGPKLEITALIDFGDFFGGHPSSDLILLAYWPRAVAESAFAEGYPGRDWFGDSMAKRRSLARLGYLMGYCAYLADTERVEEFAFIRERLRETLEFLSTTTSS